MRKEFGDKLNVQINTTDSEEAKGYTFKSATNVLLSEELVPLDVAMDKEKMQNYLSERLTRG